MDFWTFLIVIVIGVTAIEAVKDVMKRRTVTNKEVEELRQEISTMHKDIEQIKEYMADLIIQNDRLT